MLEKATLPACCMIGRACQAAAAWTTFMLRVDVAESDLLRQLSVPLFMELPHLPRTYLPTCLYTPALCGSRDCEVFNINLCSIITNIFIYIHAYIRTYTHIIHTPRRSINCRGNYNITATIQTQANIVQHIHSEHTLLSAV